MCHVGRTCISVNFFWFCSGKKQCLSQAVYFNIFAGIFWPNYTPLKKFSKYSFSKIFKQLVSVTLGVFQSVIYFTNFFNHGIRTLDFLIRMFEGYHISKIKHNKSINQIWQCPLIILVRKIIENFLEYEKNLWGVREIFGKFGGV